MDGQEEDEAEGYADGDVQGHEENKKANCGHLEAP